MLGDKVGAHQILLPKHFFQPIGGMNSARKIYRGEVCFGNCCILIQLKTGIREGAAHDLQ